MPIKIGVTPLLCIATFFFLNQLAADEWAQAQRAFQAALNSGNDSALEAAASKLPLDTDPRAAETIIKTLSRCNPSQYWILISTLAKVSSERGLVVIGDEITKGKFPEIRRDLIMCLRLSEAPRSLEQLLRVAIEGTPDVQVSAIDELVDRGSLDTIPVLISIAERAPKERSELAHRCSKAIGTLTKDEPIGPPSNWRSWWSQRVPTHKPITDGPTKRGIVGQTVIASVHRTRQTDFEALKKGRKEEILVIQGVSDSVQEILSKLGIDHTLISYEKLGASQDLSFSQYVAIFVNCGTADWPPQQVESIRKYVNDGGYLFVTDIAMLQVIKHAFPRIIDFGKGTLGDMSVEILPWKGSTGHPMLKGIDLPLKTSPNGDMGGPRLRWAIEAGGPAINYDPRKAVPLVEAPELQKRGKPTAVAVTFLHSFDSTIPLEGISSGGVYEELNSLRGGRVVCVLSHFSKQRDDADGFILQNLLINFLIEAKDRMPSRKSANSNPPKK